MHKAIAQRAHCIGISASPHIQKVRLRKVNLLLDTGESNQSVLVEINPEWIEGTDVDVKTEIKFTSVDQQRLIDVTKRTAELIL